MVCRDRKYILCLLAVPPTLQAGSKCWQEMPKRRLVSGAWATDYLLVHKGSTGIANYLVAEWVTPKDYPTQIVGILLGCVYLSTYLCMYIYIYRYSYLTTIEMIELHIFCTLYVYIYIYSYKHY